MENILPFISKKDVIWAQNEWIEAIKSISSTFVSNGNYVDVAHAAIKNLYGHQYGAVLFKPTKAADYPFRNTFDGALSYFVGDDVVHSGYTEDLGFAINGGKGWSDVVFVNHQIELVGHVAVAMGTYIFTCASTGETAEVEYTFGYKRNPDGNIRIFLHHSSLPFRCE